MSATALGTSGEAEDPKTLSANWLQRPKWALALKRLVDIVAALLLAPFVLLAVGIMGLLIKLDDGGPVIYRRRVVGPSGDFDAFKLRTMRVDADEILERDPALRAKFEASYKIKQDPRVTRIGRSLRRLSLDELPQIWNVLRGQMTLVGPRMIIRAELEKFGPYAVIFGAVKPGMTGYWQVSGRQEVSYEERVKMDVDYLQHWSLWLDFKILFKTAWKVLKQEGAY
jgi:lipopolysaccharide/colanic/teichoic acid biosynthesis glycosyltransferase